MRSLFLLFRLGLAVVVAPSMTLAFQHARRTLLTPLIADPSSSSTTKLSERGERYFSAYEEGRDSSPRSGIDADGYDRSYENFGSGGGPRQQQRYQAGPPRNRGRRSDSGVLGYQASKNMNNAGLRRRQGEYIDVESFRPSTGTRHLWIMIFATCWWYFFAGFDLIANPPSTANHPFLGMTKGDLQTSGALVAFLTLPLYASCTKLLLSKSFREGQVAVLGVAAAAAPASLVISLVNPLKSHGWTALAFVEVTMFLGVFLAHHLRQASYRDRRGTPNFYAESPFEEIQVYRPSRNYQSTMVAWDLTRSLVAFYVAISVIGQCLLEHKQSLGDLFPFSTDLWPWVLVAIHMGNDCMITALFPGNKFKGYLSYAVVDWSLYGVQVYAALSSPVVQAWMSGKSSPVTGISSAPIADQILIVAVVTDAIVQLMQPLGAFMRALDLDRRLGLTNSYDTSYNGFRNEFERNRYNNNDYY